MKILELKGKSISLPKNTYVQQIKSLFSRYTKLKKDGKLTPPTSKTVSVDDEIQDDSHE